MNCETVQHLLDEMPLSLWSEQRNTAVHEHCHSCSSCMDRLEEEKLIFTEFDELLLPECSNAAIDFFQQAETELSQSPAQSESSSRGTYLSVVSLAILLLGLIEQTFLQGGREVDRFWGVSSWEFTFFQISNSPSLAATLIFAALVYCFSSNNTTTHYSTTDSSSEKG